MAVNAEIYERYETLRKEKNVSTAEVCRATGLEPSAFSHWKKGIYQPKVDKFVKIADYFDVPITYFLE